MIFTKKSAIEVKFNWLFVLLIGGVLLYFVFSVISSQTESTQLEIESTIRMNLDTVLQQAAQTPGTTFTVQLRNARFTSSDSCADSFYLNDDRNMRIEMEAVFSPKQMDSVRGEFILWVLPWDMPFRITNFVYLTSPDIVYLLVHEGNEPSKSFTKEINHSRNYLSLPDSLTKLVLDDSDLENRLDDLKNLITRVVYIKEDCDVEFPENANSAICIEVKEESDYGGLNGWGKVKYLDPDNNNNHKETSFLGRPSLFGAIFSEDIIQFDCSMQKAYIRMKNLLEVYEYRSSNLSENSFENNQDCRSLHSGAQGMLSLMINAINNDEDYLERKLFDNALNGVTSLRGRNQESKLRSCVYIY